MIRVVSDIGAPLAVSAVNIVGRTTMPQYHDYLVYGMSALGLVAGYMNWGGDFVKQMGVSSLPLTVDKIYERVTATPVTRARAIPAAARVATRVSQTPGPGFTKNLETY